MHLPSQVPYNPPELILSDHATGQVFTRRYEDQGACSGYSVEDERPKRFGQGRYHGQGERCGNQPPEDTGIGGGRHGRRHGKHAAAPCIGELARGLVRPLSADGASNAGYLWDASDPFPMHRLL
jgi:hypothetical protein